MDETDHLDTEDHYKKQILDLNMMLEIGKTLNAASLSLKNVLDIVILTTYGHFHSADSTILLSLEEDDKTFFTGEVEEKRISLSSSTPLESFVRENERVIHIDEIEAISKLKNAYEFFKENEFELIVPLRFKERINGILCLKRKDEEFGSEYTEDEKRYINIIAGFTSVAIENARLYEMATLDRKTKLYNHGFFQNRLTQEIERAERYKTDLTLMILDLDHFKKVNDTYGHIVGDEVLIKVAQTIKGQVRTFDIPARFGGEEFTVILPETDLESASLVAQRLRKAIKGLTFTTQKGEFSIAVSIGMASFIHETSMTEDIFIEHADRALYYAKEHGRDQIVLYENVKEAIEI
ncbi:MAG: sensor domain-containing diguanylate cyclase [Spirochaetota bacterium]|nr:MAG: sensor domain-containing diguanylate cyclase [Spirochaetota bacterium]